MKLHIYFIRRFLRMFFAVGASFCAMMLLIDLLEQTRKFADYSVSFGQTLGLAALNMPGSFYTILPLVVLLTGLALFLNLARTSELVVTRASGRSAIRSLIAPVLAAFAVGVLTVVVFNPFVAGTSKQYDLTAGKYRGQASSVLSLTQGEGLWLRQGSPEGQMVIRASRANSDGTQLFDATFMTFASESGPIQRIYAASARLENGAWNLRNVKVWDLSDAGINPEANAVSSQSLELPSDLTRQRIRDSFGAPSEIPVWDLPEFIDNLQRAGFSTQKHRVWLQMELALPLIYVAMLMIAAAFTMRHTRFGRTGVMVMGALGLGLGLFFLRNFAQVLGESGQIPAAMAAWSPPVIGIMLATGLLLHLEDG